MSQRLRSGGRKGLTLLQQPKTDKHITSGELSDSNLRSVRSSSRSRGISMSRSNGINIDKIYDQRHFPNVPHPSKQKSPPLTKESPSLSTCRSLQLVSLKSVDAPCNPQS